MDFDTLTNNNSLEKIKCNNCNNFLSYFPIYISPSYQNLCGRCAPSTLQKLTRNEAYEALAHFFKFPCRYHNNGCGEENVPQDIPSHEENCHYKTIKCPVIKSTDCSWKGPLPEVLQHCQDKHFDLILTDEFEIDLANSHQQDNLIEHEATLFLVLRKFESSANMLECTVCHIEDDVNTKNCSCEIRVSHGRRNLCVEVETTIFTEKNPTKIFLGSLESLSSVFGRLSFGKVIEDVKNEAGKTNSEMLSVIKCSICSQYALPPIFHCTDNHDLLICAYCDIRHLMTSCQNCTDNLHKTVNISLNKIANWLDYPCRNQQNGCNFVSKPEQMKQHRIFCPFDPQDCPVKELVECTWNGLRKNVTQHVLDDHQSIISCLGQFSFTVPSEEAKVMVRRSLKNKTFRRRIIHCKIIQFANYLFKLTVTKKNHYFCWKIQTIGYYDRQFRYEIELMDVNDNGRRLLMGQICATFTEIEIFCNNTECCRFDIDQIETFVSDRNLMYKVNIFK